MRNLFFLLTLFSVLIFVTESSAGDREDVIADIVQSWKDFALKTPRSTWATPMDRGSRLQKADFGNSCWPNNSKQ